MPDRSEDESRISLLDENRVISDSSDSFGRKSCKACLIVGTVIIVLAIGLAVGLYFGLKDNKREDLCFICQKYSSLGSYCSQSKLGVYNKFSISVDSEPCAAVGKTILIDGGNAVDSIIAVLLCMGVTIPESMGLGGGSFIVIYNATTGETKAIDAREMAPMAANSSLYNITGHENSQRGPLAIAVPGELAGYWEMFTKYGSGRIKWSKLFEESINLCEKGFEVSEHLSTAMKQNQQIISEHKDLREVYFNPKTGQIYKSGEIMKQNQLGKTLRRLATSDNPLKLYYEEIGAQIIDDLNKVENWDHKPIITVQDFNNYRVMSRDPVLTHFDNNNITLHSFPLPGSGAVLSFIINVMQGYRDLYPSSAESFDRSSLFYHRLIETYKYGFAQRMYLGDSDDGFDVSARDVVKNLTAKEFVDQIRQEIDDYTTYNSSSGHYGYPPKFLTEDHGTAHVSIVDSEGNAVAVTATVNFYFGSKVMSSSTGIILNNEMDDFNTGVVNGFDVPPSDSNKIQPRKRPLSSMCPTVFTDGSGFRLVIGGSGGTKITTAVASVAIRNLWFGQDIKCAIDSQRLHHQLFPDKIIYEKSFPEEILSNLKSKGHKVEELGDGDRGAIIMAISKINGKLYANSDYRKGGTVDGI